MQCLLRSRTLHGLALRPSVRYTPGNPSRRYTQVKSGNVDPRLSELGELIEDKYAQLRDKYQKPKSAIVLAHGLCGFDQLHLAGARLPGIHYWRGIESALQTLGIEVITASVAPLGPIETRAASLAECIRNKANGKTVNIIAGLDSRYMLSTLKPPNVEVLSLTTIATPHRGSAFADYVFRWIGPINIPKVYKALELFGLEGKAFSQLTREYMSESFNPRTPDNPKVKYYSYGAMFEPSLFSVFRKSHHIIERVEGPNDGMVSVRSSVWGSYKGTLQGVSHLDLINWTNRLRWLFWRLTGRKQKFNAIAFYLDIADMLAREGH